MLGDQKIINKIPSQHFTGAKPGLKLLMQAICYQVGLTSTQGHRFSNNFTYGAYDKTLVIHFHSMKVVWLSIFSKIVFHLLDF